MIETLFMRIAEAGRWRVQRLRFWQQFMGRFVCGLQSRP
jgi:hypothetical protein